MASAGQYAGPLPCLTGGPQARRIPDMRLLIGYDGSPHAVTALHDLKNAGLPERGEALLLALADLFLPPWPPDAPFNATGQGAVHLRREAESRQDSLLAEAQNAALLLKESLPDWNVRAEADIDAPARGLLKRAEDWKADLLCVGAPHTTRLERLFFGSVCQRVVSHAKTTVRIGRTEGLGRPLRLMLATDGSPDAEAAAEMIPTRRWPANTEVHVVCVRDTRCVPFAGEMVVPVPVEPERGRIEAIAARLQAAGLNASCAIREGVPKDELIAAATESGAHCVFTGASGMGSIERFFMGSVSSALAARATCSVEIVRSR
jgi:nucleotide-binding universal stress UspA family protein